MPPPDCSPTADDRRFIEQGDVQRLAEAQRRLEADLTEAYNTLVQGSPNLKGQIPIYPRAIPDSAKEVDLLSDIRAATCEFRASEWKSTCEAKKGSLEGYIKRIKAAQVKAGKFEQEKAALKAERKQCEERAEAQAKQDAQKEYEQKGTIEGKAWKAIMSSKSCPDFPGKKPPFETVWREFNRIKEENDEIYSPTKFEPTD